MYEAYFDLRERPFELTPNPKYLYLTAAHREALSTLEYGLSSAKPLTVLIGEVGTGKTTLLHAALESERCRGVRCVYINNPALTRVEFLNMLALRFALGREAGASKAVLLDRLERALVQQRAAGVIHALVIDEAQRLSTDLLEEIRLLANIETATERLLPLVLAGQPELAVRLEDVDLRQLKQRVALRCELTPFGRDETAGYIAARVKRAGGVPQRLFSREAVELIHDCSQGIPRTISVICDNALTTAMALDRVMVDAALVSEVCRDFAFRSHAFPSRIASVASGLTAAEAHPKPGAPVDDVVAPDAEEGAGRPAAGRRRRR